MGDAIVVAMEATVLVAVVALIVVLAAAARAGGRAVEVEDLVHRHLVAVRLAMVLAARPGAVPHVAVGEADLLAALKYTSKS